MPYFEPFHACSANQSLAEILNRLERHPQVSGVVLLGSTARDVASWSDYDLLVVTADGADFDVEFTYVDHRPTDVVFVHERLIRSLSAGSCASTRDADILGWLASGRIVVGRSRHLETARDVATRAARGPGVGESELFFRWVEANFCLVKARRWLSAPDETYRAALELHLLKALAAVLVDHLACRGHGWEGERHAVELVKRNDPQFHDGLLAAVRTSSLEEKVGRYGVLVARAFEPVGRTWGADETAGGWTLHADGPEQRSRWERLVGTGSPDGRM